MVNIGKSIKDIRKKIGISVEDIAKELNISKFTYYKYENGQIKDIPISQLEKIARFLNIPLSKLLEDKPILNKSKIPHNKIIGFGGNLKKITNENIDIIVNLIKNKLTTKYNILNKDIYDDDNDFEKFNNFLENEYLPYIDVDVNTNIKELINICNILDIELNDELIYENKFYIDKNTISVSQNKKIQDLQKEIIDITTKIDNVDVVEDIRDIAQLKLDKSKNNPK